MPNPLPVSTNRLEAFSDVAPLSLYLTLGICAGVAAFYASPAASASDLEPGTGRP